MRKRLKKKLLEKALLKVAEIPSKMPAITEDICKTLAIELWRMRKSLRSMTDHPRCSALTVSLDKLQDVLQTMGVEIHDPCGEKYNEGMTLSVALFDRSQDLHPGQQRISEAITPTVYLN